MNLNTVSGTDSKEGEDAPEITQILKNLNEFSDTKSQHECINLKDGKGIILIDKKTGMKTTTRLFSVRNNREELPASETLKSDSKKGDKIFYNEYNFDMYFDEKMTYDKLNKQLYYTSSSDNSLQELDYRLWSTEDITNNFIEIQNIIIKIKKQMMKI